MIVNLLLVAAGGALGSALRYLTGLAAVRVLGQEFPYGTAIVNLGGSLLMGVGAALLLGRVPHAERLPLFFLVGLCGGYTTFSSYALDGYRLLAEGRHVVAGLYLFGSPVLALAAFLTGLWVVRQVLPG